MPSYLRSSLVVSLLGLSAIATGCSGGDFNVSNTAADSGTAGDESGADTGGGSGDDGGTPGDGDVVTNDGASGGSDAMGGDGGVIGIDARPLDAGCAAPEPVVACITPIGNYYEQFDYFGGAWLSPRMGPKGAVAISYELGADGRHEKLILRIRTTDAFPAGQAGSLTLTAFRTPCPGHHIPLGKSRTLPVNANPDGADYPFYFNDDATFLPAFPKGTRLTFVLTSDSTRYTFDLSGNPTPPDQPPQGLQWYSRGPDLAANWQPGVGIISARPWMRGCTQ